MGIRKNCWRDRFGPAETTQRVRPQETRAYIANSYRLAYRFTQNGVERVVESSQDVRTWLPDLNWLSEIITLPAGFQPGDVEVSVGIVDPVTRRPVVRFAIEETAPDGWHPLTNLEVKD